MDELYEKELLESLEGDDITKRSESDENEDDVTRVTKQTMENLKAGEKLMEALDICFKEIEDAEQYQKDLKAFKLRKLTQQPIPPTKNSLLAALNIEPEVYVLDVLKKIKASQLEDALLVLPFSYTVKLLKFIGIWTNPDNINKNITSISLICRTLFFCIRSNSMEFISQKDETFVKDISKLKEQLRTYLKQTVNEVGFNVSGLKFLKNQWKMNHSFEFADAEAQSELKGEGKSRKRMYTTLA
ncbi:unnamed protein product [Ambrosiozyma monospora]|uniref:Unnamed protein product n=1 Tax=Ambrosiozyma monospora TaxID=43982 RepID=A0A9W6T249_AMBMO|nr:unnamed protein product [Ambrosiozyma monospora]